MVSGSVPNRKIDGKYKKYGIMELSWMSIIFESIFTQRQREKHYDSHTFHEFVLCQ